MVRPSAAKKWSPSLLKQIIKRRPRIAGAQAGGRRSLLLPRHANLIQLTFTPRILLRNPLLHRLHALEPAPRIEIRTLLARMQLKAALRTFLIRRHPRQHRPALRTPRHRTRPRQIQRSRTHRMVPLRWAALAFLGRLPRFLSARLTITVLIPMLPIFCCHTPSPPRARIVSPIRCPPQVYAELGRRLRLPRPVDSLRDLGGIFSANSAVKSFPPDLFRPRQKSHTILP
jgi:hypothetical protein